MGMTTRLKAFILDTNPEYQKHKKVFMACHEADISLPAETAEYFGDKYTDDLDILDEKLEFKLVSGTHYKDFRRDMQEGFEINLSAIPENVSVIRFVNSY